VENKIGAGLIEEVIQVAEGELKLVDIMLKAKVYVSIPPLMGMISTNNRSAVGKIWKRSLLKASGNTLCATRVPLLHSNPLKNKWSISRRRQDVQYRRIVNRIYCHLETPDAFCPVGVPLRSVASLLFIKLTPPHFF